MSEPHNKLSPKEAELIAKLVEESGEVLQMLGKILVHGLDRVYESEDNTQKWPNRKFLEAELGDVFAVTLLLVRAGILSEDTINSFKNRKLANIGLFLYHQIPNPKGRNWEEDYDHENGRYSNTCISCQEYFIGHKRRVTCKVCDTEAQKPLCYRPNCKFTVEKEGDDCGKCYIPTRRRPDKDPLAMDAEHFKGMKD